MEKMKYKISSRATILIGREGVSRADGAAIELIKNTYDADADFCYIAFDIDNDVIYIIDNGIGMNKATIESAWMLIGTDNKKTNFISDGRRVKSGEKGIGRFALDRLGSKCTMYTKNKEEKLIYWFNNWDNFEEEGKTLDEIEADFEYLDGSFESIIPEYIRTNIAELAKKKAQEAIDSGKEAPKFSLSTGTLFKICGLRDKWDDKEIRKIYAVLGFLVPPGEQTQYYIFAQKAPNRPVEEIECEAIDDFDYRVRAKFDGTRVKAIVERNEFDLNVMPKDLFAEDAFQTAPYTLADFNRGRFEVDRSLAEITGNADAEFLRKAQLVGDFEFHYIFMKLAGGEGNYYYKPVNSKRKIWMEEHGGIKIYRDNFIVRPYGDPKSRSYDWLGLDARKGMNPVGVSDKSGLWHVNNAQIQGTVLISRVHNEPILDKSNREGIIENEYFEVLNNIITAMISIFEKDRAYIACNIRKYKVQKESSSREKAKASALADEVLAKQKKRGKKKGSDADQKAEQLAKAVKIYEEEREEFISEIKLLRALATNGLITTSMVHDLKTINSLLVSRVNGFRIAIKRNKEDLIERNLNDLMLNDEFLKAWITVITTQANKDRRKRLKRNICETIESAVKLIEPILDRKKVNVTVSTDGNIAHKRIFETDFDSIVYNLIINSIESFESTKCDNRQITITLETDDYFHIRYLDNGHGLSEAFLTNPYDIFKYGTTSKFDSNGNQTGTGLGMYIVASSVNEYHGTYTITKVQDGFGLDIRIPLK